MDVLIFCGQSNMQGATEGCPAYVANPNEVNAGRFNNAEFKIIGEEAGKALGKLRNN